MDYGVLDRRELLWRGLAAGAALAAWGCQAGGRPLRRDWSIDRDVVAGGDVPAPARAETAPAARLPRAGAQRILPRYQWTSEPPRTWLATPMRTVRRITVHHDGMAPVELRSDADVRDRIEMIRRAHVERGWADIGYHYVVDPFGRVWEGRPIRLQGAHVRDHNAENLGIVVLGNFMEQWPTPAATAALVAFIAAEMRRFSVPLQAVHTHRELGPTACPGTHLQAAMDRARAAGGALTRA